MTAGEFMRKLEERILEKGYTSNDLQIMSIIDVTLSDNDIFDLVYSVKLYSCKDREFLEFLIETD